MALQLQVSTETEVTLPLACDATLRALNPVREDGIDPVVRYMLTGDPEGLVTDGVSTGTYRALTRDEIRKAMSAANKGGRHRHADEAVWARVVTDESGRSIDARLDDLTDEEHEGLERHRAWMRRRDAEVSRIGIIALSDLPDTKRGPGGYPVEEVLAYVEGEDLLEEAAARILQISTLGKARPPSSASLSGARAKASDSASATSVPPATPATDGSPPTTHTPDSTAA